MASASFPLEIQELRRPGNVYKINVKWFTSIKDIKDQLHKEVNYPSSRMQLYHSSSSKGLRNQTTLHDLGITHGGFVLRLALVLSSSPQYLLLPSKDVRLDQNCENMLRQVREGLRCGHRPSKTDMLDCTGGVYFLKGATNLPFAVFKPNDEEQGMPNNPKGHAGNGEQGLRMFSKPGEGYIRETASYIMDYGNFCRVPATTIVHCEHDAFHYPRQRHGQSHMYPKLGSLQQFVPAGDTFEDISPSMVGVLELQRVALLDMRLLNGDRNASNLLAIRRPPGYSPRAARAGNQGRGLSRDGHPRKYSRSSSLGTSASTESGREEMDLDEFLDPEFRHDRYSGHAPAGSGSGPGSRYSDQYELVPIDHGYCFPQQLRIDELDWTWFHCPHVAVEVQPEIKAYINSLDIEQQIADLTNQVPMSEDQLFLLRVAHSLLKEGINAGLTLRDLAGLIARTEEGVPSTLENIIASAEDNAQRTIEMRVRRRGGGSPSYRRAFLQEMEVMGAGTGSGSVSVSASTATSLTSSPRRTADSPPLLYPFPYPASTPKVDAIPLPLSLTHPGGQGQALGQGQSSPVRPFPLPRWSPITIPQPLHRRLGGVSSELNLELVGHSPYSAPITSLSASPSTFRSPNSPAPMSASGDIKRPQAGGGQGQGQGLGQGQERRPPILGYLSSENIQKLQSSPLISPGKFKTTQLLVAHALGREDRGDGEKCTGDGGKDGGRDGVRKGDGARDGVRGGDGEGAGYFMGDLSLTADRGEETEAEGAEEAEEAEDVGAEGTEAEETEAEEEEAEERGERGERGDTDGLHGIDGFSAQHLLDPLLYANHPYPTPISPRAYNHPQPYPGPASPSSGVGVAVSMGFRNLHGTGLGGLGGGGGEDLRGGALRTMQSFDTAYLPRVHSLPREGREGTLTIRGLDGKGLGLDCAMAVGQAVRQRVPLHSLHPSEPTKSSSAATSAATSYESSWSVGATIKSANMKKQEETGPLILELEQEGGEGGAEQGSPDSGGGVTDTPQSSSDTLGDGERGLAIGGRRDRGVEAAEGGGGIGGIGSRGGVRGGGGDGGGVGVPRGGVGTGTRTNSESLSSKTDNTEEFPRPATPLTPLTPLTRPITPDTPSTPRATTPLTPPRADSTDDRMWGERSYKESLTGISITGMGTSITHTHSHTHAHGISVHGTSTHTPSAHHTQSAEKSARTDEGLLGALGALGAMPIVMERMEMGRGRMGPMGGAIGGALGGVGGDFDMHPPALSRVTSFAAFESPVLYDLPKSERQMARLKQEKRKAIAKTAEFQELRFSFASESALSVLSKQARVKASLEGGKY